MRRAMLSILALLAINSAAAAQSSIFGVRGLGVPGRGLSVGALGTAGANGMFDPRSNRNPAALGMLNAATTVFTSTQGWRSTETPFGTGTTREQRFPHVLIGGPIPRTNLAGALSYSNYTTRDYLLVSEGVAAPRGVPIAVTDSTGSTGGVSDFRLGAGWSPTAQVQVGAAVHMLTGSNRVFTSRAWADSSYRSGRQESELSFLGFGLSAGVVLRPTSRLWIAGSVRKDGSLDVERDSTEVGSINMPISLSAAARFQVSSRMALSGQAATQDWSVANEGLTALGGSGARSTIEFAGGVELIRNLRRPEHLPLRLGARYAEMPFLVASGSQPTEVGFAVGTGFRFAQDLGGIDVTAERIRRSQGDGFAETSWQLSIGVTLRGSVLRQ
jgi:hypothetical protein